jgi:uncharacterized membrane-anchored protein
VRLLIHRSLQSRLVTRLAARLEKLSLDNSYRFAASKAYYGLVNARIDE